MLPYQNNYLKNSGKKKIKEAKTWENININKIFTDENILRKHNFNFKKLWIN